MEVALRATQAQLEQRVQERTAELSAVNKALRESEEKYIQLYDKAPDMFATVDPKTGIIKTETITGR